MKVGSRARLMEGVGCAVGVMLLSGCSLITPASRPEPEAFLLALDGGAETASVGTPVPEAQGKERSGARVLLEQESSAPAGSSTRILFVSKKGTLGSYQFAQWAEPPANVFQRVFFVRLRKARRVADVSTSSGLIAADRLVRFRMDRFWLDNSVDASPVARVEVEISVIDLEHRRTVGQHSFVETVAVGDPSAETTVRALTEAGKRVVERGVVWTQLVLEAAL